MARHPNLLLDRLSPSVFEDLIADAKQVSLRPGQVISEAGGVVSCVYFPHSGAISNVVSLSAGKEIETSLIGRDGVFGAGNALDDRVTLNRVVSFVAGLATVVPSGRILELARTHDEFRKAILSYEQVIYAQAQQTAACNASHSVLARCCRWLLRMHDLNGTELNFTQELIARMLGVRRTSITEVAGELSALGAIRYSRGHLEILDVDVLAAHTCECHEAIRNAYARLFSEMPNG